MTTRSLLKVAESEISKCLNSNVSVTHRDVVPKKSYDRFLFVNSTTTFEYAWATPHNIIRGS